MNSEEYSLLWHYFAKMENACQFRPGHALDVDRNVNDTLEDYLIDFEEWAFHRYRKNLCWGDSWRYIDEPNNLMIESFRESGGQWNSNAIEAVFEMPSVRDFILRACRDKPELTLCVPFCGHCFEIDGIIRYFTKNFGQARILVALSDVDESPLPQSTRVSDIVRVVASKVDAETGVPSADLVLGFHPQVFAPCYGANANKWRNIIRRCTAAAPQSLYLTLASAEQRYLLSILDSFEVDSFQTNQTLALPRELIQKAAAAAHRRTGWSPHRYYGFATLVG